MRHLQMEQGFSLKSQQVNPSDCILKSQTSRLVLNNDGLQLLQDTIGAVKVAIDKINFFKNYLNQHSGLNTFAKSNSLSSERNVTDKINLNKLSLVPIKNLIDHKLQVYFTILVNKVTESDVREAFEKEGFEDFVITIKNKPNHTFGFIKFSNEESVKRALDYSFRIPVNGQLIKIRPHKNFKNFSSASRHNADTNCISKEIDEGILINVSSGYQNRRILNNYLESDNDQFKQNEDNLTNIEPDNSYHSSKAEVTDINKSHSIDSFKENIHKYTSAQSESFSRTIQFDTDMEWNENDYYTTSINNQSSENSVKGKKKIKNKEKNNVSKVNSQIKRKKFKEKKKNNAVVLD